jgi:hypothetical protein
VYARIALATGYTFETIAAMTPRNQWVLYNTIEQELAALAGGPATVKFNDMESYNRWQRQRRRGA